MEIMIDSRQSHLSGIALIQLYPFVPLMNIVGVLPQKHTVQEKRPAGNQLLKTGQSELQVNVIWREESPSVKHAGPEESRPRLVNL